MCEKCTPEKNASVIRLWLEFARTLEPFEVVILAEAMGVEFEATGTVQCKTITAKRGGVTLVFLITGEEVSPD
jgi:hypothetical protein